MAYTDKEVRDARKSWWLLKWNPGKRFPELEALANPESWGDPTSKDVSGRYSVLSKYLRETYVRCKLQGKVVEGAVKGTRILAFNTGLLTPGFDEIVAVFGHGGNDKWNCQGFVDLGHVADTELGRTLNAACAGLLPVRATFLADSDDVLFRDKKKDPWINFEHIVRERIYRFPPAYVAKMCGLSDYDAARFCEDGIEHDEEVFSQGGHSKEDWLSHLPEYDSQVNVEWAFRRIRADLWNKVLVACKCAVASYSLAVPVWYPTRQIISLLLPLCLAGDEPDLAMVMAPNGGRYQGYTVLDLHTARADARLVTAPAKDWVFANDGIRPLPGTDLLELDDETPSLEDCAYLAWGNPEVVQLILPGMTIGRGSATQSVEVKLEGDAYAKASRLHGQFLLRDGRWFFKDVSKNGTAVRRDGAWIDLEKDVPFELRDGDRLRLGHSDGTTSDVFRSLVRFMLEEPLDDLATPQL